MRYNGVRCQMLECFLAKALVLETTVGISSLCGILSHAITSTAGLVIVPGVVAVAMPWLLEEYRKQTLNSAKTTGWGNRPESGALSQQAWDKMSHTLSWSTNTLYLLYSLFNHV